MKELTLIFQTTSLFKIQHYQTKTVPVILNMPNKGSYE
jgi:hypothetical protein